MKRKPRAHSRAARTNARKSLLGSRRARLFALLLAAAATAAVVLSTVSLAQKKVVLRGDTIQSPVAPASVPVPGRNSAERSPSDREKDKDRDSKRRSSRRARQQDAGVDGAQGNGNGRDRNHPDPRPKAFRLVRAHSFDGDLRSLPNTKPEKKERPEREGPDATPSVYAPPADASTAASAEASADAGAQTPSAPNAPSPGPSASFEGLDFANWGAGHPPDTNGDVGKDYYIQTINTSIGIFRKSDGVRVAAFTFNTFMSQGHFGNLCDTNNFGDPVVLYDTFEDRWIITDFAFRLDSGNNVVNPPGAFQCFAASKTSDPVAGGWNFYSINTAGGLGDYPKLGIWPDGVYMSVNMFGYASGAPFQNSRVYALNKAQMYAGEASVQVVSFDAPAGEFTILPANARLQTGTPPPGSPNYFAVVWQFLNVVSVYKFHVDWNSISTSTFTGPFQSVTPTWWAQYSNASATTVPSPANRLDSLYPRLMMQNQYTNIGGVESLWDSHTVGAGNPTTNVTSAQAAVRYYQVKVTGGSVEPSATQSFTYSPDATVFRYMPSTAVDRGGDMAIGYSASSSTLNPAIRYAGRLGTDPVNSITQTEQSLVEGTGTQSGPCNVGGTGTCTRWGDYSAMSVDTDGCTFWYTNMYYQTSGNNHHTRIGSFKFPQCVPSLTGGIQGQVTVAPGGSPIAGATVALGSRKTTTDASGNYSFADLPSGTYPSITASFPGYSSSTTTSVVVSDGATTTVNFSLAGAQASSCLLDTTQADFQAGVPTNLDLTTSPGDVTLFKPSLDQQNTVLSNSGFGVTTAQWIGQTFTPSVSGTLTKLDINLFCATCSGTNPPVTIDIRTTSGGLPTGTVLASTTVPGFSSGAATFYTANFASPPALTSGTSYAIMARLTTARATGNYDATFATTNPYSGGVLVFTTNGGASWGSIAGDDLGFRTYMNSGFAPSGNLVSGLKDSNPAVGSVPHWGTLFWTATTPANTSLTFQAAASNSAAGPFSFVGPDGTASTFFANGASLAQFNGSRYLKYKAVLTTASSAVTPTINDVTVCFNDLANTTLQVAAATGTYGGTANLSATLTAAAGPVSGKTVTFTLNGAAFPGNTATTDGSGVASLPNVSLAGINAGTYNGGVAAGFAGDSTDFPSSGSNTLTVGKADQTINFAALADKTYGDAPFAVSATGGDSGNAVTFSASGNCASGGANGATITVTGAGQCTVTASQVGSNNYNAAADVPQSFTIHKADAHVSVNGYSGTYDGHAHGATGTATGVGGEDLSALLDLGQSFTDVPGGTAHWTFAGDANYNPASGDATVTLTQAAAVITVNGYSGAYDGQPHGATGSAAGVQGEDLSSLLNLGQSYTNVPGGTAHWTFAGNTNYQQSSGDVPISIGKATPTINWNNPADIVYGTPLGGAQLNATASTAGGFVYTPAFGAVLAAGNNQTLHVAFTPADAVNFNAASKNVSINVLRATLTFTADNKSKTYGDPNPPLTYTASGFVNNDTPATAYAGSPALTTAATQASDAGLYQIASAQGSLSSANYAFSFVPGTLTVNKAALTVKADDTFKLLGAPLPAFTASYSGFVLGQGPGVLVGTLTFSTPATAASPSGSYPVTPSGLTSPNYNITFVPGTLNVGYNVCAQFDQTKANQSGSTIPVKLQLCSADGTNQSSASVVVHAAGVVQLPSNAPVPLNDAGSANPGGNFRFDSATYIFNLKTTGYAPGTYQLVFTVSGDPTTHTVQFSVR